MEIAGFALLLLLSCIGVIHLLSLCMLGLSKKYRCQKRIFLVHGTDWERQLGAIYTYYQWSPRHETENWLLLDYTPQGSSQRHTIRKLAQELGAVYVPMSIPSTNISDFFTPDSFQ